MSIYAELSKYLVDTGKNATYMQQSYSYSSRDPMSRIIVLEEIVVDLKIILHELLRELDKNE